jgi:CheY-like chemotaxis protein
VAESVAQLVFAGADTDAIDLCVYVAPELPRWILCDPKRLRQVLLNLLGNAVKFSSTRADQSPHLALVVEPCLLARGQPGMQLRVTDDGIGMSPQLLGELFQPFTQGDMSTARRFGGTGLGLSISQRLVALMGGELRLTSALGEGSTFAFSLQMQAVLPVPAALESVRATPVGVHRVLVVDNNPVARELLARTTRNWGWPTEVAASGEAALQVVQAGLAPGAAPFDLIYMDWQMPDMDGWATTRQLRQRYAAHAVAQPVVVMVSANSRASLEQRTVEEQALLNAFLMKPVTASMLLDAVQDASACGAGVRRSRRTGAGKRRLSGMHILVVEDNLINQQVAEELLMSEGALVSMAANGQLGVDAIGAAAASKQFDAVLMDMQMPVLDGFGATRVVRQQLQLARLPIIAMTANAMASDRVECLAAGMNEHVGKPFDLDHLVHTLLRVTGFKAPQWMDAPDAVVPTAPLAAPAPSAPAALDMAVVDATVVDMAGAQARMGGSSALYLRLAQQFVESLAAELAQLQAALAGPPAQATLLAHSLKGTAAILGALQLSQRAADLEKLCKAQAGGGELNSAWLRVESAAQETAASLQAALQALEAGEAGETGPPAAGYALPQPAQREAVSLAMAELMPLLQAEDFAALEIFAGMRAVLAEVPEALLSPLEEALQDLDMERALQACGVIDDWSSACQTQASRRSPSSLKKR